MSQTTRPPAEDVRRERDLQIALRKLYCRHAATLIRHFDEWRDDPRYYFIELRLDMTYYCAGLAARVADPPYHLGTVVRNSLENPELFSCECPSGHRAYAYANNGSPLSGRFDLGMACLECGWNAWVSRSGWKVRSEALRATQVEDAGRLQMVRFLHPAFRAADLRDLLRSLGVPEEELVLPPVEHRIERTEMPDGTVVLCDLDGGSVIVNPSLGVTFHDWNGPAGMVEREVERVKARKWEAADGED